MEQSVVAALLEKYWLAETSVQEEEQLAAYFRQDEIAPELAPFREIFNYFASEASIVPGDDLGDKILERIAGLESAVPVAGGTEPAGSLPHAGMRPLRDAGSVPVRKLSARWGWAAAAAIVLGIGIYLAVASSLGGRASREGGDGAAVLSRQGAGVKSAGDGRASGDSGTGIVVKDTYDDPKLALAALQKALLTVSTKMNRGKKITQQQMGRMTDSWQTVMRN
jgi:hypothetical protein